MRRYETMRRKQDSNAEMTFFWIGVMSDEWAWGRREGSCYVYAETGRMAREE
jgi:hypothetical protein